MNALVRTTLAGAALLAAAAAPVAVTPARADDLCTRPICRDGYRYDGRRCVSGPAPVTLARSHHDAPSPLCRTGWRVQGADCVKINCCVRAACRGDERYRDGYCHSAPTFFGWRSHRRANCDAGWVLDGRVGVCRHTECPADAPPPARAAGRDDGLPRRRDADRPPPPARPAVRGDAPPRPRPVRSAPPPPVTGGTQVERIGSMRLQAGEVRRVAMGARP